MKSRRAAVADFGKLPERTSGISVTTSWIENMLASVIRYVRLNSIQFAFVISGLTWETLLLGYSKNQAFIFGDFVNSNICPMAHRIAFHRVAPPNHRNYPCSSSKVLSLVNNKQRVYLRLYCACL